MGQPIPTTETPTGEVFTKAQIIAGTLFCGPLGAAYFVAKNFRAFNNPTKARQTWIIGLLFTAILVSSVLALPQHISERVPNSSFAGLFFVISIALANHFQFEQINEHIQAGGGKQDWGSTIMAILAIGGIYAMVFIFYFLVLNAICQG